MSSDAVMKNIEGVLHPAMNIYDNLNLGRQWNVPGKSTNALPITCDNCGGPHTANKFPQPRNKEKCKKAREARQKASNDGGRGQGGRGGRGSRGGRGGCGDQQSRWNGSSDSTRDAKDKGVQCINGVWMMKCKDCGWNTTHSSKYCGEAKRQGSSFVVPASHPYWALSNKAHPSATSAGGSTAGSNNDSTISSRMSTLIDSRMTSTESSEVASLLAEIKSCLQGN